MRDRRDSVLNSPEQVLMGLPDAPTGSITASQMPAWATSILRESSGAAVPDCRAMRPIISGLMRPALPRHRSRPAWHSRPGVDQRCHGLSDDSMRPPAGSSLGSGP